jgi:uncharacterized protein YbjT (DUF2867 family)
MKVVLFGASGMVGQGVLRECLRDDEVTEVVSLVRRPTDSQHAKLREIVHSDFTDFTGVDLVGVDACLFCLGVSAVGMTEHAYRRITYDFTLAAARALTPATFLYVSGAGTSATGRAMWARVKGETENALLALADNTYMFRPGFIMPMYGSTSKTGLYRVIYAIARPLNPLLVRMPKYATSSERLSRAMLQVAQHGYSKRILESVDINAAS